MPNRRTLLFELSLQEFEDLAIELLESRSLLVIKKAEKQLDPGYDLEGRYEQAQRTKEFAAIVRHKRTFTAAALERQVRRLLDRLPFKDRYLVITSARLDQSHQAILAKYHRHNLRIYAQAEIDAFFDQYQEVRETYLRKVTLKIHRRRLRSGLAFALFLLAAMGVLASSQSYFSWGKPRLTDRIAAVEATLANIKTLETDLNAVKTELIATERETALILAANQDAKLLKNLNERQKAAIRAALQRKSWQERLLDWGVGLLMGIGSSLIAGAILRRHEQRKAIA